MKSEKCYGGKLSKICITGMEAANAMGDKLPMFIFGKAKNPQCFECQVFTLSLQESTKNLDGWEIV